LGFLLVNPLIAICVNLQKKPEHKTNGEKLYEANLIPINAQQDAPSILPIFYKRNAELRTTTKMRSFLCDLLLTSILLIALPCSSAQNYYDFSFQHEQNITVSVSDRQFFLSPWCGGLNAIRVSEFDLNHDDIMDLLIFDKHGNKLLPFLNLGINDSISYQYAP